MISGCLVKLNQMAELFPRLRPRHDCDSIFKSMRRLSAYLALSVIWAGVLNPFVTAAQLSTVPACCRRNGMHHCQIYSGSSRETGFQSQRPKCPHATPLLFASATGLESEKFNFSAPAIAGLVAPASLDRTDAEATHNQSARAPPSLL